MRSIIENKIITILGGSGFIGRYIVQNLAKQNALIKVGCRDVNQAMHLLPLGTVSQIKLFTINVRDEESLRSIIKGSDYVINLVGIFHETGKQKFDSIHHQAAIKIAHICQEENVQTLIHFSALGADLNVSSHYAKTKAEGENRIQTIFPKAVIIRPSLIFGAEDHFFNRFAELALLSPFLPLIHRGQTQFQPVFVNDVAQAVETIISQNIQGEIFELGGAMVYTFKQLMEIMLKTINRSCRLIFMPNFIGYAMGSIAQYFPNPILTVDQMRLLKINSVLTNTKSGFNELGISPKSLETIIPTYLKRFHS